MHKMFVNPTDQTTCLLKTDCSTEKSRIAQIRKQTLSTYNGPDGTFRDRLKLDNKTGSLTITNITTQHAGRYELEISGAKLTSKPFSVSVYGDSHPVLSMSLVALLQQTLFQVLQSLYL
uniref:Immunoglobulin V-set domain-containing protein n=1 Tax=Cyprinus carpio TaxID=7962 RepID=A0A8C1LGH7_CYPCA